MSELVERIADAIERVTIERQGQGFHLVTGRNDSEAFARAALSVLEPRIEVLEREVAEAREIMADPNAVHVNMLRGTIAKPSLAQIIHIYGSRALVDELVIRGAAIRTGEAEQ